MSLESLGPRRRLRAGEDHRASLPISVEALVPLCGGLGLVYGMLIPLHLLQLDGRARVLMAVADALLAAFFLAQRQLLLKGGISPSRVRLLAAANIGLPYLSVLLLFFLEPDPSWTGFVLIILIGCGALFLSLRWLVVSAAVISTSWPAILLTTTPWIPDLQFAAVLLTAVTLAGAIFASRRRAVQASAVALARAREEIRQRQATERELEVLSRAVEQSSSVVLITDPEADITYVNPKFTEVTGYEAQEVLGHNPRILKFGETPPEVYADLWQTLKNGDAWQGEFKNTTKSGEPYWVLASISPIQDDAGHVINYVGVQEDITARKRAEETLVKAQRLEAVGRLVSGIAHDFNNLLTSILGFSEMAASELDRQKCVLPALPRAGDLGRRDRGVAHPPASRRWPTAGPAATDPRLELRAARRQESC